MTADSLPVAIVLTAAPYVLLASAYYALIAYPIIALRRRAARRRIALRLAAI